MLGRLGCWLLSIVALAIALFPRSNTGGFGNSLPYFAITTFLPRLCVILFFVSLIAPVLEFTHINGRTSSILGIHFLLWGWKIPYVGGIAWLCYPFFAIAISAAMWRKWTTAYVLGILALIMLMSVSLLLLYPLRNIDGVPEFQLTHLDVGFYMTLGAFAFFIAFSLAQMFQVSQSNRTIACDAGATDYPKRDQRREHA
jgi:hypothetical protein